MVDSTVMQSGRYKAYPEYKDSGVEWLGEIPPHWEISKLRYMFDFGSGLNITKANLQDTGIPCISYGEVHSKFGFEVDTERHDLKFVDEKYLVRNPSALLNKGDLVFADTSEDIEGSGNFTQLVSDKPAFAGYHTVIARPKNDDCSRFYAYLMDSKEIRTQIRHIVKGVKVFTISQSILKGVNIWLPSLRERQSIANFLDYETAKIDTLIEKQQRLIELLSEKRQAVISHAVTKGLNPDVPMKESGVEWLGEVPEHWDINKLRYKFDFGSGLNITKANLKETGVPCINYGEIHSKYGFEVNTDVHQLKCVDELYLKARPGALLNQGDFIFADTSEDIEGAGNFTQLVSSSSAFAGYHTVIARPKDKFGIRFYAYLLDSVPLRTQIRTSVKGVKVFSITQSILKSINIWIPPLNEREEIAEYLDEQTYKIDDLIAKANQQIELMQERRTALISAAVTGKIDVRDWVKPE